MTNISSSLPSRRARSGSPIRPSTDNPGNRRDTGNRPRPSSSPKQRTKRCASVSPRGRRRISRSSATNVKSTSSRASDSSAISSWIRARSACAAFRKRRRAGTLKNRSRTSSRVPSGQPHGIGSVSWPPSQRNSQPSRAPLRRLWMRARDTAPIDASASPRNPRLPMWSRSATSDSLLVAWLANASGRSSGRKPSPSSAIRIDSAPPCLISIRIRRAPASSEFSTSSLTTDDGRSTTSPAAIWLTTAGGSFLITVRDPRRSGSVHHRTTGRGTAPAARPHPRRCCG